MPTSVDEIIAAARECIGTPFGHQGRVPGRRLDCVGLVRYPAVLTGLVEPGDDYTNYGVQPNPQRMAEILARYLDPVQRAEPGCILWLEVGTTQPQHLAILTRDRTIIHAFAEGPSRVTEHGFRPPWPGRVMGVYRYRGVDYV